MMRALPPLALYVHLPWCVQKCPYCDFNSYTAPPDAPRRRYLDALSTDLASEAQRADGRMLTSVFLGGGTPSFFSPAEIGGIVDEIARRFAVADDVEITMEANPGTVECGDPHGYRQAGVNRLSIGAQSFDDGKLEQLGRIHSAADIGRAVNEARDAGFDNINIDIMYGLSGQSVSDALADIEAAHALSPSHLSWYHLTLEPNTVFHARPPPGLPDDELAFEILCEGESLLGELGFGRYEVSAWSKPGRECRHNLNYWTFGDYLAAGAGAHGKLSTAAGVYRYSKAANPLQYMKSVAAGVPGETSEFLGEAELVFEFMLNAARLVAGFDPALFESRTGLSADLLARRIAPVLERGLIELRPNDGWRPTQAGHRFLNDLQGHFLPA